MKKVMGMVTADGLLMAVAAVVLVFVVFASGCASREVVAVAPVQPQVMSLSIEDGYTALEVDAKLNGIWEYVIDMQLRLNEAERRLERIYKCECEKAQ